MGGCGEVMFLDLVLSGSGWCCDGVVVVFGGAAVFSGGGFCRGEGGEVFGSVFVLASSKGLGA
jgi:hypothetical protein